MDFSVRMCGHAYVRDYQVIYKTSAQKTASTLLKYTDRTLFLFIKYNDPESRFVKFFLILNFLFLLQIWYIIFVNWFFFKSFKTENLNPLHIYVLLTYTMQLIESWRQTFGNRLNYLHFANRTRCELWFRRVHLVVFNIVSFLEFYRILNNLWNLGKKERSSLL